jgi:succinyl-diaminopimelate desuccinylase
MIIGPGEPRLAHQTDEYCEVAKIHESVAIYASLLTAWCNDTSHAHAMDEVALDARD